jgi:hypothetical protein
MTEENFKKAEKAAGERSPVNRNLSREAERMENCHSLDKSRIGFIGISGGAGTTFLTVCLARFLANTRKLDPAVVELGKGSIYDSIGMDKHFAGRDFFGFFKALEEGKSIRGRKNMDEGINWIIRSPEELPLFLSYEQKLRLINSVAGNVILYDFSGCDKDYQSFLELMDQIIVIIDPLPSKMLEGYQTLCRLKAFEISGGEVIYTVNKHNKGINQREMHDFLKIRNPYIIPMVSMENIYTAEYTCKIPYSLGEVKSILYEPIRKIAEQLEF